MLEPDERDRHPSGSTYAGWWRRAGAALLDGLVLAPLYVVVAIVLDVSGGVTWPATILGNGVAVAYDTILDGGRRGQTVGRRLTGIRVVAEETGGRLGYGRAFGRSVFTLLLGLPSSFLAVGILLPLADHLWPLVDARRQTWHDKAVGSVVVRT